MSPKVTSQQTNFTAGEFSRKALGRSDLAKYQNGAKKLENFFINQLGGASFRPGTRYIASTKNNGIARLIPFQYSSDQDYVIEAGDLYFRIYNNDATAVTITSYDEYTKLLMHMDGADASTAFIDEIGHTVTPVADAQMDTAAGKFKWTSSALFDGTGDRLSLEDSPDWDFDGDFTIDCWVMWGTVATSRIMGNGYTTGWMLDWRNDNTLNFAVANAIRRTETFTPVVNTWYHIAVVREGAAIKIYVNGTTTGSSNYATAITSANPLYIASDPDELTSNLAGWIDELRISKGIARWTANFTAPTTPYAINSSTEITTPYLEADIPNLHYAQHNDILYIVHPNYWPRKLSRTSTTSFALTVVPFKRPPLLDTNITATTITPLSATGNTTLTASTSIFTANHVGSYWRINSAAAVGAIVKITGFTSVTVVSGTVQAEPDGTAGDIGGTGAYTNWAEGAFSGLDTFATIKRGFPATIAFHEQRLYYGNTTHEPQKFWGSYIGAYDNFDNRATTANYAITFEVATEQRNAIRWLSSGNKVLNIGTIGGTFSASSGDSSAPISPTNIMVNRDTNYGCANLLPKRISSFIYYMQRDFQKLRELSYNFQIDSAISNDMTLLAEHILKDGTEVIDLDHQQAPNDRIWCVRDDGEMAVLTRNPEQDVMGWCRAIAGKDSYGDGEFESVCVIPKAEADDQVWVIVKRKVLGVTKRFIEYFTTEDFTDAWDAVRCDSSVTRDTHKDITGMTNASPGVFTCTAHGFTTGDQVKVDGVVLADVAGVASTEINGIYLLVEGVDANKFSLTTLTGTAINTTTANGYGVYVSGGEIRLMTTAVTGLGHLVGETIVAQVDGYIPPTETYVVQAGGTLTLSAKAAVVHCGLPYEGTIQLLKLSDGSAKGTGQTQMRRIYYATLRLDKTQGLSIGRIEGELDTLVYNLETSVTALFTGDMDKVFKTSWARGDEIIIKQTKPLPANVLAVVMESEVS